MFIVLPLIVIGIVAFILALMSMKDFETPAEIAKLLMMRKMRGTIIFLKNKVHHYSSSSSST